MTYDKFQSRRMALDLLEQFKLPIDHPTRDLALTDNFYIDLDVEYIIVLFYINYPIINRFYLSKSY